MEQPERQLYKRTSTSFVLPHHVTESNEVKTMSAGGFPVVRWPDGSYCFEANHYLLDLRMRKALSAGTLVMKASQISHLLRFCWRRRIAPLALSDSNFISFVKEITPERKPGSSARVSRSDTTVNSIARCSLDFLHILSLHASIEGFLGPSGQILAEQRQATRRTAYGREIRIAYWHHSALPTPDPKVRRLPVSSAVIDQLKRAAISIARARLEAPNARTSRRHQILHTRARRLLLIALLETTGARIAEIAQIRLSDFRAAERMEYPLLRVPTLKDGRERLIPMLHSELKVIREYIDFFRAPLLRALGSKVAPHDFVLVSRFGTPILAATLSNEFGPLRREANVSEQACAHMFRHRFITKLFVRLINEHNFKNQDEFRRKLLDAEAFKRKVMEWTGHRNIASLDHYIHLAFEEISGLTATIDAVSAAKVIDSFRSKIRLELALITDGADSPKESLARIARLLEAADLDLIGNPGQ